MILRKVNKKRCPACLQIQLEAIEVNEGKVSFYICNSCGAHYDAEVIHDYEHNEHWWMGKLRNPDFWTVVSHTIIEDLAEIEKRNGQGITEYLGSYPMERIKAN